MPHALSVAKHDDPHQFCKLLQVTPSTFNKLLKKIENDPVFNNSNNIQIPVEEQLAIALYHFRHNGNAVGQASVGHWAGAVKGATALHTKCMMTAILCPSFMKTAVHMPT